MYKTILSAAVAALISSAAYAGDMPTKYQAAMPIYQAPSWAGFYVGLNGGYGASSRGQSLSGADTNGAAVVGAGLVPTSIGTTARGGMYGATVGYNWQFGQIVAGIEADLDMANVKGSSTGSVVMAPYTVATTGSQKLSWLGTARGRLGYSIMPNTLVYGTGGLAIGKVDSATSVTVSGPAPFNAAAAADTSKTKTGWALGAGIEQALGSGWSVKAEYLYVNLGTITNQFGTSIATKPVSPVNFSSSQKFDYQTVKVGLNYRF